jgi:hypothetical protein
MKVITSFPKCSFAYMTAEWDFIQGLSYKDQTPEDADFIRLIYTSRLRKYKHTEEQALTRKRLVEDFGLSDNPDVLYSFADALYTQFRWADCFAITSRCVIRRPPWGRISNSSKNIRSRCNPPSHHPNAYSVHVPPIKPSFEAVHPGS